MSLLVYAIAEGAAGAARGVGLDGRPLIGVEHDGLALIASQRASSRPTPTLETLRRYERIVEGLMALQPILPARFGSLLPDDEAARSALRDRHDELRGDLERVRGAVELGVRGDWTHAPAQPPPRSGTEYLLGQLDIRRRAGRAARFVDPLRALSREVKVKVLPQPSVPFLAACLVDRDRADEFIDAATKLGASFEDGELVCTGPWPPYSFVQDAPLDRPVKGGRP
jgi:hypothetical protein